MNGPGTNQDGVAWEGQEFGQLLGKRAIGECLSNRSQ